MGENSTKTILHTGGGCIIITFKRQSNHIVFGFIIIIIWKFFQNFFPFFEHYMYDDVGTHQRKRNEGTIDPALLR